MNCKNDVNKFLIKSMILITIFCSFFVVNRIINQCMFYNMALPVESCNVLIAGDSHVMCALDPEQFYSAENIAQSAEPYVLTYWKLDFLFNKIKVDTLLLGFAHHNISEFNDFKFSHQKWATNIFTKSLLIGKIHSLQDISVDYTSYLLTYIERLCRFPHKNHFTFIGRYEPKIKSDVSNADKTIQRHFYFQEKEIGVSAISLNYLDAIFQLCEKHNVYLILVTPPVHHSYFSKIPDRHKENYDSLKEQLTQKNIPILDFSQDFYADTFYYDSDHLNVKGANKFSETIIRELSNGL